MYKRVVRYLWRGERRLFWVFYNIRIYLGLDGLEMCRLSNFRVFRFRSSFVAVGEEGRGVLGSSSVR